ncbi:MAG: tryptophan synthase subunit alpha [Acidimicrobiales bacterium]
MSTLEERLRLLREQGRTALVPYFVGGLTQDWVRDVETAVHAGADAVEIGVPFSDPMIDGAVIQEGARRALERGTTLDSVCADLATISVDVPLVVMTYYNIVHHYGLERAAGVLGAAGIRGAIIPDLTIEEAGAWRAACDRADIATVFLVAPSTPPERVELVTAACAGFVYAAARMAVTGRSEGIGDAREVVERVRAATDLPAYVGIGVTTPDQARSVAEVGDGVIVGSALVSVLLGGAGSVGVEDLVGAFRSAID